MNKDIERFLVELREFSLSKNVELFLVGGAVRDILSDRIPSDYDFTGDNAIPLAKEFANEMKYPLVKLDETPGRETFRVVKSPQIEFDFTAMQGGDIEEDLMRRDFSINAMAMPLSTNFNKAPVLLDPANGEKDLKEKKIRVISPETFKDDPLRILRAFRFAAQLKFEIEPETANQIRKNVFLLKEVAVERIFYELKQFLKAPQCSVFFPEFCDCGLLKTLFPESDAFKNKLTNAFNNIENIVADPTSNLSEAVDESLSKGILDKASLLKLCAILYPIRSREKYPAVEILQNMNASNSEIKWMSSTIEAGKYAYDFEFNCEKTSGQKGISYSLAKRTYPHTIFGIILAASIYPEWMAANRKTIQAFIHYYCKSYFPARQEPSLLNGHDLIDKFKLQPGPQFKNILDELEDARILGEISTKEQAWKLAENLIKCT